MWDSDDPVFTTELNAPIIRRDPQTLDFEPGLAETHSISGGEILDANDETCTATQLFQDENVDASGSLEVDGQPTTWQLIDSRT